MAGRASGEFADGQGVLIQFDVIEAWKPSGEGERLKSPVHMEPRICCFLLLLLPLLSFYCEGWGAVLSGLLS